MFFDISEAAGRWDRLAKAMLTRRCIAVVIGLTATCSWGAPLAAKLPPEALTLPSIEQVLSRLSITATEYSTHLQLDAPDVAAPGAIAVSATSQLPGTTRMLLFRGGVGVPAPAGPQAKPGVSPPAPALIASWTTQGNDAPQIKARYEVHARQWITLIAQAQGRWFVVAREIKVGKPVGLGPLAFKSP